MFDIEVRGLPCQIEVTHFVVVPPDPGCTSSDMDYRGYSEIEFDVMKLSGKPYPWLQYRLTQDEIYKIENRIIEEMERG